MMRFFLMTALLCVFAADVSVAQRRSREIGVLRLGRSAHVLTVTATDGGTIWVATSYAGETMSLGEVDPARVEVWLDSARAIAATRPNRQPRERLEYEVHNRDLGFLRTIDDHRDEVVIEIGRSQRRSYQVDATVLVALGDTLRQAATVARDLVAAHRSSLTQEARAHDAYFEFQVSPRAKRFSTAAPPVYPDSLKAAGVEGEVLAQFVVDSLGRVEPSSIKILRSTHELFSRAVIEALPKMDYTPAMVGSRRVRQLVQEPFAFTRTR